MNNDNITFEDINKLSFSELEYILRNFIEKEDFLNKTINFDKPYSLFKILKESMLNYFLDANTASLEYMVNIEKLIQPYKSNILYVAETLENMNIVSHIDREVEIILNNSEIITRLQEELKNITFNFYNEIGSINQITKQLVEINNSLMPHMQSIIPEVESLSSLLPSLTYISNIGELLRPQIDIWSKWFLNNQNIIESYNKSIKYWEKFYEEYKIKESEAITYLKKYHWFISPNMESSIVYDIVLIAKSESEHKKKDINHLFYDYFFGKKCKNLKNLIELWEENIYFKKRIKFFKSCINLINNSPNNFNFSNFIVPLLITQIDGIQNEIMRDNNLNINLNDYPDGEDIYGKKLGKQDKYFRLISENNELYDAINDVFLSILFQTTYFGEGYNAPMHLSRHKILHGENINFGRKEYAVRCLMILDFLYEISKN